MWLQYKLYETKLAKSSCLLNTLCRMSNILQHKFCTISRDFAPSSVCHGSKLQRIFKFRNLILFVF